MSELAKDARRARAKQLPAVRDVMADGQWRTLQVIQNGLKNRGISASEASISARLRDLRHQEYGAHRVDRMRVEVGLYAYRVHAAGTEVPEPQRHPCRACEGRGYLTSPTAAPTQEAVPHE